MKRREFLAASGTAFLGALFTGRLLRAGASFASADTATGNPKATGFADPLPEISAAVDVLVPADPDIPGDFKGTDYHGDRVLASQLGDLGQAAVAGMLNQYAQETAGKDFLACTDGERLEAVKAWVRVRADQDPLFKDMLTGLLTISVIGTYEYNPPEEQTRLFTSMGWFDPADPTGTFRIPCEGYVDSYQFPAMLKDGVRK